MDSTQIESMKKKIHDCLVGGAMGDALGYPVEFMSYEDIVQKFGPNGIRDFYSNSKGVAEISDDTQMTLFTAASALMGVTRGYTRGIGGMPGLYTNKGYMDWYNTQQWSSWHESEDRYTWLMDVPELYARRSPGNTCLSAAASLIKHEEPQNDSCGCGGVMRTAPLAAICATMNMGFKRNDEQAAYAAAVTHKHHLGYIPAAILNHILYDIFTDESGKDMEKYISEAISYFRDNEYLDWRSSALDSSSEQFKKRMNKQLDLLEKTIFLANSDADDVSCIHRLGGGWTGHEALCIAVFCALRYPNDIDKALIAAVNHSGDSDSTGSIAGQIVGAYSGIEDTKLSLKTLEILDVIEEIAKDCATICPLRTMQFDINEEEWIWEKKYYNMRRVLRSPQLIADELAKNIGYFFAEKIGTLDDKIVYEACREDSHLAPTNLPKLIIIDPYGHASILSMAKAKSDKGEEILKNYKWLLSTGSEGIPKYEYEYMKSVLSYASKYPDDYDTLCCYLAAAQRHDMELDFVPEETSLPQEYYIKLVKKNYYTHNDKYWACGGNTGTLPTHITPTKINGLKHNEIFVFGSNKQGHHIAGAAKFALDKFGAKWGFGEGLCGQSYALPTMEGKVSFQAAIVRFMRFAKEHPEYRFYVTPVGCGIAGYTPEDVALWFNEAISLKNVYLPVCFWEKIIDPFRKSI